MKCTSCARCRLVDVELITASLGVEPALPALDVIIGAVGHRQQTIKTYIRRGKSYNVYWHVSDAAVEMSLHQLETLTAIIRTEDIRRLMWTERPCKSGHWTMTICCCTTPRNIHSPRWQRDYSPDLCWISTTVGCPLPASSLVLGNFPHSQHRPSVIHIGLQLPIIRGVQRRRWNFKKADWASYTLATERSIPLIPVNISVEESYQRFCGAMQKAAHHFIPWYGILRVWMRSAKIYWSSTKSLVTQT